MSAKPGLEAIQWILQRTRSQLILPSSFFGFTLNNTFPYAFLVLLQGALAILRKLHGLADVSVDIETALVVERNACTDRFHLLRI